MGFFDMFRKKKKRESAAGSEKTEIVSAQAIAMDRAHKPEARAMWIYESVTRQEFESIKDIVEKFIVMLGGNRVAIELPYEQRTRSIIGNDIVENISTRPAFEYKGQYYRVDEVCFSSKPCIVIEFGTYDELINNIMDEAEPFPYDLTEDELLNEVKYSLGIEPYPENY